jgi:hypothetical protein
MQQDLILPSAHKGKLRREWGTQNMMGLDPAGPKLHSAQTNVQRKIDKFISRAVYPQQLSVPRQYATTREGSFIYRILEGRVIDGYQEQGVRVVVQENAQMARFVISPLFSSTHDARSWASQNMGAV